MERIIEPVDRELLKQELNENTFIRPTNNGNNQVYIVDGRLTPNVLKEIGRLREVSFRSAGGGSGKCCDIDKFDTGDIAYKQLIVWKPEDEEIIGGYRYILNIDSRNSQGEYNLSTAEICEFSDKLKNNYFPYTIELGRSFVQPKYQPSSENRKGLFSLDNLWDGLGALIVMHPEIKYFYGKVTMYSKFNREARDLILSFLDYYFPDHEQLITLIHPVKKEFDTSAFINAIRGLSFKDGHHILNQRVRALGENIPPLVNSYMNLSPTMKTLGTSKNPHFGDVEETGILVTIADIYPTKKDRHVYSYLDFLKNI
jgi:hypothetical protein